MAIAVASPMACASNPPPKPLVVAPLQPNLALLEFVGEWSPEERELLTMEKKAQSRLTPSVPPTAPEGRDAP